MRTYNENYVQDVNEFIFTVGALSSRGALSDLPGHHSAKLVRHLGLREARSKNKRQFSKASSCSGSTNVLAPQLERRMEAAQSIPTGISSPSQEKS